MHSVLLLLLVTALLHLYCRDFLWFFFLQILPYNDCCLKMPLYFLHQPSVGIIMKLILDISTHKSIDLYLSTHTLGLFLAIVAFICRKCCTWENMQPKFLLHKQQGLYDSQPLYRCHQRQHGHAVRARQLYPHPLGQDSRTGPLLAGGPGQGAHHPPDQCLWR